MAMSFIQKLTPEIRRRWSDVIGEGSVLREGSYGMTESHTVDVVPYGFHLNDHDLLTEPVFCGLPVPGTDVLVVDPVAADPMPVEAVFAVDPDGQVRSHFGPQIDGGIHSLGKKVIEEAGEVWIAAEYQSDEELAEEISQLLYWTQVMMLKRGLTLGDVYRHL